jgi:hypothetical protein
MELGRWSVAAIRELLALLAAEGALAAARSRRVRSATAACANLYSRGSAAVRREAQLRREAVGIVRGLIGSRSWRDVVPIELTKPTFTFLTPGAHADASESDDGLDGVSDAPDSDDDGQGAVAAAGPSGA